MAFWWHCHQVNIIAHLTVKNAKYEDSTQGNMIEYIHDNFIPFKTNDAG